MKHIVKGWTVGLIGPDEHKLFLGRFKTNEGKWYATSHHDPCHWDVYGNLFDTAQEAMDFWKTCKYYPYEGKNAFKVIPIQIELSVEVQGLGFDWNGFA